MNSLVQGDTSIATGARITNRARLILIGKVFSVLSIPLVLWAYNSGAPQRSTGAPGDQTCIQSGCHVGTRTNDSSNLAISWEGGLIYTPGFRQKFTVRITDQAIRYGFQASARLESSTISGQAGSFRPLSSATYVICDNGQDRPLNGCPASTPVEFITHSQPNTNNTFEFEWTPPLSQASGAVILYVAANASNGPAPNGAKVHLRSLRITPVGSSNTLSFLTPALLPSGQIGQAYRIDLASSGGNGSRSIGLLSGNLPPGLTLSSSTGVIFGTPISTGTFTFSLRLADSIGAFLDQSFTLAITTAPLSISSTTLQAAAFGVPYSAAISASGGTPPYLFTLIVGSLPPGLILNSVGVFSGTPTQAGTFQFTIRTLDLMATSASAPFSITVAPPVPVITATSLPDGLLNSPYSARISATSPAGPNLGFLLSSGSLPLGLNLRTNGVIDGTPTVSGSFTFTIQVTDSQGGRSQAQFSINIAATSGPLRIPDTTLLDARLYYPYSQIFKAEGGNLPYRWTLLSGILPNGLTLNSSAGSLIGTPLSAGAYTFVLRITDQRGINVDSPSYTMMINEAVYLATARVGQNYQGTFTSPAGLPPFTHAVASNSIGNLPPGLSFATSGTFSGLPTTAGLFTFGIVTRDSHGNTIRNTACITILPATSLQISPPSLPGGTVGTPYTQPIAFIDGNRPTIISLVSGVLPPGLTIDRANNQITGTPVATGTYFFTLNIGLSEITTAKLHYFTVTIAPAGAPSINAITNAASYANVGIAPGQLVTAFGRGIGPEILQLFTLTPNGTFPSTIATTRVLFDGQPAPLIYTSRGQLSAVSPFALQGKSKTTLVVEYDRVQSAPIDLLVLASQPGIFTLDGSGTGQGAILNQDGTLNSPANPASRGSVIVLFATGAGQMQPPGIDGKVSDSISSLTQQITAEIDGRPADVLYAGNAPGLIQGVIQLNLKVPSNLQSGKSAIVIRIGGNESQLGVHVRVED